MEKTTRQWDNILAKGPTVCSCEYRNCEYLLRRRPLWGHEPCEGGADMCGRVRNINENDRSVYGDTESMIIVQGTQKLNMRELIRRGTSMRTLATRPEVLAVYVDPRWLRGDTFLLHERHRHSPRLG